MSQTLKDWYNTLYRYSVKSGAGLAWAPPNPITFGTMLGPNQLNAQTRSDSPIAYTHPNEPLTAGTHDLTATVNETDNYREASVTVQIQVDRADPNIQWGNPQPIVLGTALSKTQLNATWTGTGTATYDPDVGEMLDAGTRTLTISVSQGANHTTATATVSLQVKRKPRNVQWTPARLPVNGQIDATHLNATWDGEPDCSAKPQSLPYKPGFGKKFKDAGTHTLSLELEETDTHEGGTFTADLIVELRPAGLTFAPPSSLPYGAKVGKGLLKASADTSATITYTPSVNTTLAIGQHNVKAEVDAEDDYDGASITRQVTILKADQTISVREDPIWIPYRKPIDLDDLGIATSGNGKLTSVPAEGSQPALGVHTLAITAASSTEYNQKTKNCTLIVGTTVRWWMEQLGFSRSGGFWIKGLSGQIREFNLHLSVHNNSLPSLIHPNANAKDIFEDLCPEGDGDGIHLSLESGDGWANNTHYYNGGFGHRGKSLYYQTNQKWWNSTHNKMSSRLNSELAKILKLIQQQL